MKQLFLTCLILCAPVAAKAEINLTGEARMGLVAEGGKTQIISGMRLTAQASRVTDGGVELGAVIDLNQPDRRAFRHDPPRGYVYMSTGNLTVQVGNGVDTVGIGDAHRAPELGF